MMNSIPKASLLIAWLVASAGQTLAQTTYTYNGSSWSDGSSTVTAPVLASGNSVVIQSGSLTCGVLTVTDQTSSTAGVNYTSSFSQTFKPMHGGSVSAVSVYKLGTGNAGMPFVLKLYQGTPSAGTLLHTESFVTVSDEEQRVTLSSPVLVSGMSTYSLVVENNGNPSPATFKWRRTQSNVYSEGALYLGAGATSQDLWFRLRYDHSLGNLTIAPGASLTMDFCDLNVAGNLDLSGTLTLNAEFADYSQLKVCGSVTGHGTMVQKQFLTGSGYHALASSVTTGFDSTSGSTSALFSYNANTGGYYTNPSLTAVGQGYFGGLGTNGFASADGNFWVAGKPNTSHTYSLGYSSTVATGGSGSGWNLIGNPYSCGLDWNSVTKTNVNNAIYVWDPASTSYRYYVNGIAPPPSAGAGMSLSQGVVPPLQAFWVQATQAGATVATTMSAHGTTATTPRFFKSAPVNLRLSATQVGRAERVDWAWVVNNPSATLGFDGSSDAWKMANTGGMPNLALVHEGARTAVNAIDLSQPQRLGLDLRGEAGAKFTLALDADSSTAGYQVILEDHLTATLTDLTAGPATVTHAGWTAEGPRFTLWMRPTAFLGSGEASTPLSWAAYADGQLVVSSGRDRAEVRVLAMDGRELDSFDAGAAVLRRALMLPAGTYLVEVAAEGQREVHRVTLMP